MKDTKKGIVRGAVFANKKRKKTGNKILRILKSSGTV